MTKRTFDPGAVKRAARLLSKATEPPPPPQLSAEQVILGELYDDLASKRDAGWSWDDLSRLLAQVGIDIPGATISRYMRTRGGSPDQGDADSPAQAQSTAPNVTPLQRPQSAPAVTSSRTSDPSAGDDDSDSRGGLPHAGFRDDV